MICETRESRTMFMEAVELLEKFPYLDYEVEATLREELVALFVEGTCAFEQMSEAELTRLHEFLTKEDYLKVSVAMLKKSKAHDTEGRKLKAARLHMQMQEEEHDIDSLGPF